MLRLTVARQLVLFGALLPLITPLLSHRALAGDGAAEVPAQDLRAGNDPKKRFFLIGPRKGAEAPAGGFRLLLVLPGGDGSADFHPFIKRIFQNALSETYLVAQLVAPVWSDDEDRIVWPTKTNPWPGMKFSTEEFVQAVVEEVKKKHKVDPGSVFTLGWSSGGPPCYAASLQKDAAVQGSLVAMSVFKPETLPPLDHAKGQAYYLLHSPQDFIPIRMAEAARDTLRAKGAKTELVTYEGGHGWRGDVFGNIRKGIEWLEANAGKPAGAQKE